jgi:hypothetical protein
VVVVGVVVVEVEVEEVVNPGTGFAEGEQCKTVAMGIDLGKYRLELGLRGNALRGASRRSEVAIGDWDNANRIGGSNWFGVSCQITTNKSPI